LSNFKFTRPASALALDSRRYRLRTFAFHFVLAPAGFAERYTLPTGVKRLLGQTLDAGRRQPNDFRWGSNHSWRRWGTTIPAWVATLNA